MLPNRYSITNYLMIEEGTLMGYILPVQPFQYNDYQNRIIETKQNPQFIDKPFKVILEKQHQEITKEYERINKTMYRNVLPKKIDQKVFASLTGKGSKFNESV